MIQAILAFDVSNFSFSAALRLNENEIRMVNKDTSRGHDAELVPILQELLQNAGLEWDMLKGAVTTTGPGSFTGVRVGLATAKALSLSSSYPVLGVNNFDFIMQSFMKSQHKLMKPYAVIAVHSGREDLYAKVYQAGVAQGDAFCMKPKDWTSHIPYDLTEVMCIGNGAEAFSDIEGLSIVPYMPDAGDLAELADKILSQHQGDLYPLIPYYLRNADVTLKKTV